MRAISRLYTGTQTRELDRIAIEEHGVPGITLMRRAGLFAFDEMSESWPGAQSVSVVCGAGNNAGDGYIVAGLAHNRGIRVQLVQVGDASKLKGDALTAYEWVLAQGVETVDAGVDIDGEVVVDALLGTGATGEVRPQFRDAIARINQSSAPVVAIDVPSGISADTGAAMTDEPVAADLTVTFIGAKLGLFTGVGVDYAGEVRFSDLDVPPEIYEGAQGIPALAGGYLPSRPPGSHKNRFGHVLILGGDHGMGGAALLAAEAAMRTGAGLVSVATRSGHEAAFIARRPEVMARGLDAPESETLDAMIGRASVVAVGPGLGRGEWGHAMLQRALSSGKPLVVDADALNIIADEQWRLPDGAIITPHPGEAARLLSRSNRDIQADRARAVHDLAGNLSTTVILKGAGTLIADSQGLAGVCLAGNPGLATAGSGDVLTGVVAAVRAQGLDPIPAASMGVWLHAHAGDVAVAEHRGRAMVAGDIIDSLRPFKS